MHRPQTVVILILALSTGLPAATIAVHDSQLNPANGHTYLLIADDPRAGKGVSWSESEAFAQSQGGHLATVRSAAENAWIAAAFPQYPFLWIGLSDAASEGHFEWTSGEPLVYENWWFGEPNNFGDDEDYVEVYNFAGGQYRWNDNDDIAFDSSGWGFAAVAELVPEPASIVLTAAAFFGWLLLVRFPASQPAGPSR